MIAINAKPTHWMNQLNDELEAGPLLFEGMDATVDIDVFLARCEAMREEEEEVTFEKIIESLG